MPEQEKDEAGSSDVQAGNLIRIRQSEGRCSLAPLASTMRDDPASCSKERIDRSQDNESSEAEAKQKPSSAPADSVAAHNPFGKSSSQLDALLLLCYGFLRLRDRSAANEGAVPPGVGSGPATR